MGDDPLARSIRTALPGYRLEPHYLLFALRTTSTSPHILQLQADADLRPRARDSTPRRALLLIGPTPPETTRT